MDFTLPPEIDEVRRRIRAFVEDGLIPLESDPASYDAHENIAPALLQLLRAQARAVGLWALQMPKARGGGGLSRVGMAACYEEMNRSIFGPVVFNSAAPDDGNMMLLERVGTEAQKRRWLQPIIEGEVRSAFAMTEPMDEDGAGCGSDPSLTLTTAARTGTGWVVRGRKWFITGAEEAKHFILVARTSDDTRRGLSAFLFHADQPGWRIVRRIPIMGPEEHGGHCELVFEGLEIPEENLLMTEGDGLKATQIRLGPARLTHCMRWLGLARRSLEIAEAHVQRRRSFGQRLIDHESVQTLLGQAGAGHPDRPAAGHARGLEAGPGRFRPRARSRWPRSSSPTRCSGPPTPRCSCSARADIRRTRWLSGSTATPGRPGSSMARAKCTAWSWPRR